MVVKTNITPVATITHIQYCRISGEGDKAALTNLANIILSYQIYSKFFRVENS